MVSKNNNIHKTAVIADDAVIGEGTVIEPYVMIDSAVVIGKNNRFLKGSSIRAGVKMGDYNTIGENAVVGIDPSNSTFDRSLSTGVRIGDHNIIKEHVTIERSTQEGAYTEIGSHNFFMVNSHIAHDCAIKDSVVLANYTALAGHVSIDSNTFISGGCLFHQFLRIGRGVMVGAFSKVGNDIPPYIMVEGYIGRYRGINVVGLKRLGFSSEDRNMVKKIYDLFYQGNFSEGVEKIQQLPTGKIRDEILTFLTADTKRSFVRKTAQAE